MAAFPAYVKIGWQGAGEQPAPVVSRTEMDRGIAKQRRISADTVVQQPLTLFFDSAVDAAAFETWFYSEIDGGAAWFDFTSLRTGGTVQARIVEGRLGPLTAAVRTWYRSRRDITIEWVRAAL